MFMMTKRVSQLVLVVGIALLLDWTSIDDRLSG